MLRKSTHLTRPKPKIAQGLDRAHSPATSTQARDPGASETRHSFRRQPYERPNVAGYSYVACVLFAFDALL